MPTHVAFLRGINVGGHHKVPMKQLRALLSELEVQSPGTLLASGNAWFDAPPGLAADALGDRLAHALQERFGFAVPVVVRTVPELLEVATTHPLDADGVDPRFLHVLFLDHQPDGTVPDDVAAPDRVLLRGRHLYVHYVHGAGRSRLTLDKIERHLGTTATGRNWNTVRKVADKVRSSD